MKKEKIDFFSSPNPISRHFNLNNLFQQKFHQFPQPNPQDLLFVTPAHKPQNFLKTPIINIDPYFSCTTKKKPKHSSAQSFELQSQEEEQDFQNYSEGEMAIEEKISFSEEEEEQLLIQITPKNGNTHPGEQEKHEEEDHHQNTTKKKSAILSTPMSEGKTYEKGLKKLANQAYKFVCGQKKTIYKEVARKLIYHSSEREQQEIHVRGRLYQKRGQMNIKRRVYDALNVLIALGLLKRNGNKIMCKKSQSEIKNKRHPSFEMRQRREQFLQNQFQFYKKQLQKRELCLNQKTKMVEMIMRKMKRVQDVHSRNSKEDKVDLHKIVQFPLLMICREDQMAMKNEKWESDDHMAIVQETRQSLRCGFGGKNRMRVFSDVQVLELMQEPIIYEKREHQVPPELQNILKEQRQQIPHKSIKNRRSRK